MFSLFSFRRRWQKKPSASTVETVTPQCGEVKSTPTPQCGVRKLSPQEALEALQEAWRQQAEASPSPDNAQLLRDARWLGGEFRRQLQAQPALIGFSVSSTWVRSNYPLFCRSLSTDWQPPAYTNFAKELAGLMPRRRRDEWRAGKRLGTSTFYDVLDQGEAVVELAGAQRKRA
jgi:hypothetical protein